MKTFFKRGEVTDIASGNFYSVLPEGWKDPLHGVPAGKRNKLKKKEKVTLCLPDGRIEDAHILGEKKYYYKWKKGNLYVVSGIDGDYEQIYLHSSKDLSGIKCFTETNLAYTTVYDIAYLKGYSSLEEILLEVTPASVTASSEETDFEIDKAFDGDKTTFWKSEEEETPSITVYFGSTYEYIQGIKITKADTANTPKGIKIYSSSNGSSWGLILTDENILETYPEIFYLFQSYTKYIKIEVTESQDGSDIATIADIQFYIASDEAVSGTRNIVNVIVNADGYTFEVDKGKDIY